MWAELPSRLGVDLFVIGLAMGTPARQGGREDGGKEYLVNFCKK